MGQTLKKVLLARSFMPRTWVTARALSSLPYSQVSLILAFEIVPVEPMTEAGEHLVADRSGADRGMIDVLRGPDQFHHVPGLQPARGQGRDVQNDGIHGHAAKEGQANAIKVGRRRVAPVPSIGIAKRYCGGAHRVRSDIG